MPLLSMQWFSFLLSVAKFTELVRAPRRGTSLSKGYLNQACEGIGIRYISMTELLHSEPRAYTPQ
jgi:hypothetical protein